MTEANALSPEMGTSPGAGMAVAGWEIGSVMISILIGEWIVLAYYPTNKLLLTVPLVFALSLIVFSEKVRGETPLDIGWRLDNFGSAVRLLVAPTLMAGVVIVAAGWWLNSFHFERRNLIWWMIGLPFWALAQQFVLQGYINRRAQLIFGKGIASVILVAVAFALMHFPNPFLCLATFAGGLIWATIYQRNPNIVALAISHAALSFCLAMSLPGWVLNSLRVGYKYLG